MIADLIPYIRMYDANVAVVAAELRRIPFQLIAIASRFKLDASSYSDLGSVGYHTPFSHCAES